MTQIRLESGFDLNVLRRRGRYLAPNAQNAPSAGATWLVEVENGPVNGVSFALQTATNTATGAQHKRTNTGGTWTGWSEVGSGGPGGGPADTDALPEGAANFYFTNARAIAAAAGPLATAIGNHESALDPHPQYLTLSEGDARYLGGAGRILATANLNLYVATTGNDTTGTGEIGAPFASLTKAWQVLCAAYDGGGFNARINMAEGTYGPQEMLENPFGWTTITVGGGDGATAANVIVNDIATSQAATSVLIFTTMHFNRTTGGSSPLTFTGRGFGKVELTEVSFQMLDEDTPFVFVQGPWEVLQNGGTIFFEGECARLFYIEKGAKVTLDTVAAAGGGLNIGEDVFYVGPGATMDWPFPSFTADNNNYYTYFLADGGNFYCIDPSGFFPVTPGQRADPRGFTYAPIEFSGTRALAPGDELYRAISAKGLHFPRNFTGASAGMVSGTPAENIVIDIAKDGVAFATVTLFTDNTVSWEMNTLDSYDAFGGQVITATVASGTTTEVSYAICLNAIRQP